MSKKPEGPIFIDHANALLNQMAISDLVKLTNILLNRLTERELAEVFYDLGYEIEISLKRKERIGRVTAVKG